MVARDRDRVEVADAVLDELLLHVGHAAERELGREDAGVLRLILLEDVRLHGPADRLKCARADLLVLRVLEDAPLDQLATGRAEQAEAEAVVAFGQSAVLVWLVNRPVFAEFVLDALSGRVPTAVLLKEVLDLLVDGRVEEHRQDRGRGPVDRHRDRCRGGAQVEARIELLHVVQRGDRDAGGAHLAVDVGAWVGVAAVQRDAVEGRRQPLGGQAEADEVKPLVGAFGRSLAREHARRVLPFPLQRKDAGREGKLARQVL